MRSFTANKLAFGEFELDLARRLLMRDGETIPINAKAFDLLVLLAMRSGEVSTKEELLDAVWEGQFVEEGNLAVQISALRKALGEQKGENRYIATIPRRGYCFTAEVRQVNENGGNSNGHKPEQLAENEVQLDTSDKLHPPAAATVREQRRAWPRKLLVPLLIGLLAAAGGSALYRYNGIAGKSRAVEFHPAAIKRLTQNGKAAVSAISPDGKLFAYVQHDLGMQELWLGHTAGGEPVQLRPPSGSVYLSLKFSPDGSDLYFSTSANYGDGTLYRMPVVGGVAEKVRDDFRDISFSPDGHRLLYVKTDAGKGYGLYTLDLRTNEEEALYALPTQEGTTWRSPTWSPDGTKIALTGVFGSDTARVFVVTLPDGGISQIGEQPWRSIPWMSWFHDGSGIVMVAIEKNYLPPQLWSVSWPDGEARRITSDLTGYLQANVSDDDTMMLTANEVRESNLWLGAADNLAGARQITFGAIGKDDGWYGLAWSRDGRLIYASSVGEGYSLFAIKPGDSQGKQLIPNGGVNIYPTVTDDGRFVVFQSNRSGHFAVWVLNTDSGSLTQVTGEQTAGEPVVSPDGKWIVYDTSIEQYGELMRMPLGGGEAVRLLDTAAGWPGISPDSKRVACGIEANDVQKLAIIDLEKGTLLQTFDLPRLANLRLGARWTPDGKAVAYRDWGNGIWKQDLSGGPPQRLAGLPEEKLLSFGWSPDGRSFAFARGTAQSDVVLIRTTQ